MRFNKKFNRGLILLFLFLLMTTSFSFIKFNPQNKNVNENYVSLSAPEDPYEPNDNYFEAFDLSYHYNKWLRFINGEGAQYDDDWYQFHVGPEFSYLVIYCTFINISGNIDIDLYADYDPFTPLAISWTENDEEYINYSLSWYGLYYIRVHGLNKTNNYDLKWFGEDIYEENNDVDSAYDISLSEQNDLTGIQLDDDWYRVEVHEKYLHVDVNYDQMEGNIDFGIYQYDGINVSKITWTDGTWIDIEVPWSHDWYYIKVEGDNSGLIYNLWWEDYTPDDPYEHTEPYNLPEARWLSTIKGSGIQNNDDWYEINVQPGETRLIVFLLFHHWEGDINLEVRDSSNITTIVGSYSSMDNEFIDYTLSSSGIYYLRVFFGNAGNPYDLLWDGLDPSRYDDDYEENDDSPNVSTPRGTWMTSVPPNLGLGIQWDDDWYEVYLEPDQNRLFIELIYSNTQGNIGIEIFNRDHDSVGGMDTWEDNEFFDIWLPSDETYFLRVYGDNAGVIYDLKWEYFYYSDPYEPNNYPEEAYDLRDYERNWLSQIHGTAVQEDEDWYLIDVTPGFQHLIVNLTFDHFHKEFNIELYKMNDRHNIDWNVVYSNYSMTGENRAVINYLYIDPGLYVLQIRGDFSGVEYNMWWDDVRTDNRPDDNYEENDDIMTAYDLSNHEHQGLWMISGLAIQNDTDWYKIQVRPGFEHLYVFVTYDYQEGAIGLEIYNWASSKVTGNFSMKDNDYINYELPSNGTYYIKIFGDYSGNIYNLRWDTREPSTGGMIPGYDIFILLLAIMGVVVIFTFNWKRSKKYQ